MTWECPRCGSKSDDHRIDCRLCRRPKNPPPGWGDDVKQAPPVAEWELEDMLE